MENLGLGLGISGVSGNFNFSYVQTLDKINKVCYTVLMVDVAQLAEHQKYGQQFLPVGVGSCSLTTCNRAVASSNLAVYH